MKVKRGDRVRVTYEGVVTSTPPMQADEDGYIWVEIKPGAEHYAPPGSYEVLPPKFEPYELYLCKQNGLIYRLEGDGNLWFFGDSDAHRLTLGGRPEDYVGAEFVKLVPEATS